MSFHFANIAAAAASDSCIDRAEIADLRRAGWADGRMSRAEADAVFAAQHAAPEPSTEWCDFFVEAIENYVLRASEPVGYASDEEARWLIDRVEEDGRVCSMTELELLTRLIEKAEQVPEALKAFVLSVLECAVLTGVGPTRCGGELSDTHVSEAECALIRRVVFGTASDRPAAVSRREAEMLFRLKDATLEAANAPQFARLFVQGVGNYLMGFASPNAPISRERALELDAFLGDNRMRVGRFLGEMAIAAPGAFDLLFSRQTPRPDRQVRVANAARLSTGEQAWLGAQIDANGEADRYDRELIAFLEEEIRA